MDGFALSKNGWQNGYKSVARRRVVKQNSDEKWAFFRECAGEAWRRFCKGAADEWHDQMRNGLKGLLYRFYVEPFVIIGRWVKYVIAKAVRR